LVQKCSYTRKTDKSLSQQTMEEEIRFSAGYKKYGVLRGKRAEKIRLFSTVSGFAGEFLRDQVRKGVENEFEKAPGPNLV